jgi:hypothetical protein
LHFSGFKLKRQFREKLSVINATEREKVAPEKSRATFL